MEIYESYYDEDLDEALSEAYEDYEEDYDESFFEDYDEADYRSGRADGRRDSRGNRGSNRGSSRGGQNSRGGRSGQGGRSGSRGQSGRGSSRGARADRSGRGARDQNGRAGQRSGKPNASPGRPASVGAVKDAMDKAGDVIDSLKKKAQILEDDKWINLIAAFAIRPKLVTTPLKIQVRKDDNTYEEKEITVATAFHDNLTPQIITQVITAMRGKGGIPKSAPLFAIILFALLPDVFRNLGNPNEPLTIDKNSFKLDMNSLIATSAAAFMIFKDMKKK